ncbi:MAG TPA: hypothetical protein VFF14_05210 [Candidatus Deferrimicrobium sp.]|nr:hypothetical protein [Candidatus Deferrimicrobium sp.]
MQNRKLIYVILVSLVIFGSLYVHFNYFFNPLTFRQNDVTYLSWGDYTRPIQVEYLLFDDKGCKKKSVTNEAEVQRVFDQLKKGFNYVQSTDKLNEQQGGRKVDLTIRRLDDGAVVLYVEGIAGQDIVTLSHNNRRVELTEDLKRLIAERLAQAEYLAN